MPADVNTQTTQDQPPADGAVAHNNDGSVAPTADEPALAKVDAAPHLGKKIDAETDTKIGTENDRKPDELVQEEDTKSTATDVSTRSSTIKKETDISEDKPLMEKPSNEAVQTGDHLSEVE